MGDGFHDEGGASGHSKLQTTLPKMSHLPIGGKEGKEGVILGSTTPKVSANDKRESLTFSKARRRVRKEKKKGTTSVEIEQQLPLL